MKPTGLEHQAKIKDKKWHGDTLVSHALGKIDGYTCTNSFEAFESNYAKGHRTFEVDLCLTQDRKVVLAHDWHHNADIQKQVWTKQMPPTEAEFKSAKIYNHLTPLSYTELLQLMNDYTDIWIITDTKNKDKELVEIQFRYMVDTAVSLGMETVLDRIIIQIYNEEMYYVVNTIYPFNSYIFTLYQRWNGDKAELIKICRWCKDEGISTITMPIKLYSTDIRLIVGEYGIDLYVHTENDVFKARELLKNGARGIYTDSLSAADFKFLNVIKERRKEYKKRKRYKKIISDIIKREEMVSCVDWIRRENKEVVIFGAGTYGHQIYDILKCQGIDTALFCDNNKYGCIDEKTGIRIVNVDTLKNEAGKYLVLLCIVDGKVYVSLQKQLKEAGFHPGQLCGMREYIDSLTVENLEIPSHVFDYVFFIASFVLIGTAAFFFLYWHHVILLMSAILLVRILGNSADWLMKTFGNIELKTVIYQLYTPMKGTGKGIVKKYCSCIGKTVIELSTVIMLYCLAGIWGAPAMGSASILTVLLVLGIVMLYGKLYKIGVPEYIRQMSEHSRVYEEKYVDPVSVRITFPKEKKNLIHIYLESMEMTNAFIDIETTGENGVNLIPHLTDLASENISFSHTKDYGGARQMPGTGWTMAGILASTSGISFILPIHGLDSGKYVDFLPKLETLGNVLERNGYRNYFMCGSDAGFAGRDLFFKTHGNYEIYDLIQARKEGVIPEKYHNGFWGMEDFRIYEYAKDKLTEISRDSQPFNFTLLTVDTHPIDGYLCEKCPHTYSQKYANVISCADNQIYDFVNWLKTQEWYKDTIVVITGDHLSMVDDFYSKHYREEIKGIRTIYNCFLNTQFARKDIKEKSRDFWTADLFPSILGALGADIEGNQLGLGVNLFSDAKTLIEEMGIDKLFKELEKYSMYYKKWY